MFSTIRLERLPCGSLDIILDDLRLKHVSKLNLEICDRYSGKLTLEMDVLMNIRSGDLAIGAHDEIDEGDD